VIAMCELPIQNRGEGKRLRGLRIGKEMLTTRREEGRSLSSVHLVRGLGEGAKGLMYQRKWGARSRLLWGGLGL